MIRIEGTNRVGEKIWLETNCLLTARAFIDELITYEYKDVNDENISAIRKEPEEYESIDEAFAKIITDELSKNRADLQAKMGKTREVMGVKLPEWQKNNTNDAVEDNSLGGVNYIHVIVPRGA